ncbi:hypothetical protein Pan216_21070 [Planctomycetes bacterium Pan216]|uniref:Uncharacterized protein n=1 Tax=Kolteria novifilia TaxID=2527975 RepID=A0A518B2N9_9BACT|nr:hypothetical protein Pan216_21070 [Planctomycetes bacterium Pan216]
MDFSKLGSWLAAIKKKPKTSLAMAIVVAIISAVAIYNPELIPDLGSDDNPAPVPLQGWAGEDEAEQAWNAIGDTFPKFAITPAHSSKGSVVNLWDAAKLVNDGKHLETFDQKIGDCVSQGAANAINYLQCVEIALHNEREEFRSAFQPYIYGTSRVQIGGGRLGRSDGSLGVWAADAVRKYGVLAADAPNVPPYSGDIAKEWGHKGPPSQFIEIAKEHIVGATARVHSYEEIRDAITNGYPVTIASNQGFQMRAKVIDGRLWGIPSGSWAHQMCFVAVDDTVDCPRSAGGGHGAAYCLNSWGEDAHAPVSEYASTDDAPPGGFWVAAPIAGKMAQRGEAFAFSAFNGFPAQSVDFSIFGEAFNDDLRRN